MVLVVIGGIVALLFSVAVAIARRTDARAGRRSHDRGRRWRNHLRSATQSSRVRRHRNILGQLPRQPATETAPSIAAGGFTVPRITASDDLKEYYADNTTFGVLIVAVGPDIGSEVAQVLGVHGAQRECVQGARLRETITTALGNAVRISLTGCGVDNLGTKVLLSIQIAEPPLVIGIRMQDTGDLAAIQIGRAVHPGDDAIRVST